MLVVTQEVIGARKTVVVLKNAKITPAGWHERYFGGPWLSKAAVQPSQYKEATVWRGGQGYRLKDTRIVSPQVEKEYQRLSDEIDRLFKERQNLLAEHFLEFDLATEDTLPHTAEHVYPTKKAATDAYDPMRDRMVA